MSTIVVDKDHLNNIYFTSDLHLEHENIIKYCNRPFRDKYHMNEVIIDNWNSIITEDDTVIIGGDFCLGGTSEWCYYLDRLNGSKILVIGNHDKGYPISKFSAIYDILNMWIQDPEIKGGQRITVCHYAMLSYPHSHQGAWQLFGHWHSNNLIVPKANIEGREEVKEFIIEEHKQMTKISNRQYDIGVDGNNFYPISYQQVKQIITSK